jgi:hypothetical protein
MDNLYLGMERRDRISRENTKYFERLRQNRVFAAVAKKIAGRSFTDFRMES